MSTPEPGPTLIFDAYTVHAMLAGTGNGPFSSGRKWCTEPHTNSPNHDTVDPASCDPWFVCLEALSIP